MVYELQEKYDKYNMSLSEAKSILGDRATFELKNMKKALTKMRLLNNEEEEKRLKAVKILLDSRKFV